MVKNGLAIITLGLLFFIFSANARTGDYNWPNIIVSVFFIIIGIVVFKIGNRREKEKKAEDKKHGNR